MLDGEETVQIACGELRWEGARQHAGRRGNRGNSLRRASPGGSETACQEGLTGITKMPVPEKEPVPKKEPVPITGGLSQSAGANLRRRCQRASAAWTLPKDWAMSHRNGFRT